MISINTSMWLTSEQNLDTPTDYRSPRTVQIRAKGCSTRGYRKNRDKVKRREILGQTLSSLATSLHSEILVTVFSSSESFEKVLLIRKETILLNSESFLQNNSLHVIMQCCEVFSLIFALVVLFYPAPSIKGGDLNSALKEADGTNFPEEVIS